MKCAIQINLPCLALPCLILKYNSWFYTICNIKIHISLTGTMVPVSGSVKVALFCFLLPPLYPCPSPPLGWHGAVGGHGGLSHCLWVLSVSQDLAPCMPGQSCPPVALTWHPDSHTQCTVSRLFHMINLSITVKTAKK